MALVVGDDALTDIFCDDILDKEQRASVFALVGILLVEVFLVDGLLDGSLDFM